MNYLKSVFAAALLLVPFSVNARESIFVGASVAAPELTFDMAGYPSTTWDTDSDLILKAGIHDYDHRIYGSLHLIDTGTDAFTLGLATASYDFLFGRDLLKGYLGASLGLASYDEEGYDAYGYYHYKDTGLAYGIQLGVLATVTYGLDLDIGYNYLGTTVSASGLDLSSISYFSIGMNYRFR